MAELAAKQEKLFVLIKANGMKAKDLMRILNFIKNGLMLVKEFLNLTEQFGFQVLITQFTLAVLLCKNLALKF